MATFEKSCRLNRLIWSPLLPFVYSIVSIRSICIHLLDHDYSTHDMNTRSPDFKRSHQCGSDKRWRKKMVPSPADETTFFISRWWNVKYTARCYYFSFVWLHNQLKLVRLCFMYHNGDDVSVLHDFIRFHYQYPVFPTALLVKLKNRPSTVQDITHQRQYIVRFRHLDMIILPFVYWKRYLWSRLTPPTNLVNWSKRTKRLFERSLYGTFGQSVHLTKCAAHQSYNHDSNPNPNANASPNPKPNRNPIPNPNLTWNLTSTKCGTFMQVH